MNIHEILSAIGVVGTIIGVFMVYDTLKCNHDWNRRKYTLDIMKEWNDNVMRYAIEVERVCPHLFDIDKKSSTIVELTLEQATKIYTSTSQKEEDKDNVVVRHALNSILNQFEFLATAYMQNVADKQIIEESFKKQLIRLHKILSNYLKVVEEHRKYQPWEPYINLVEKWEFEDKQKKDIRKPTA